MHWASPLLMMLTACQTPEQPSQQQNTKPNIIILADDMGFSDLGCTGSEIETPNLDNTHQDTEKAVSSVDK